jgi:hypothetical protein
MLGGEIVVPTRQQRRHLPHEKSAEVDTYEQLPHVVQRNKNEEVTLVQREKSLQVEMV